MKSVLYVDDEEMNLFLFETSFGKFFNIKSFESPTVALAELAPDSDFDVIVSDMKMPDMNGIEFISKAKKILPDVDCYILTGYGFDEDIEEAIKTGLIKKVFTKPYVKKKVIETLSQ